MYVVWGRMAKVGNPAANALAAAAMAGVREGGPKHGGGTDTVEARLRQAGVDMDRASLCVSSHVVRRPSCTAAVTADISARTTHVNGGTLTVVEGYEFPDHRNGKRQRAATFVNARGDSVRIQEWNTSVRQTGPTPAPPGAPYGSAGRAVQGR